MKALAIALLVLASAAHAEQTVEETRKNIRVLQGLPESQLFMAMNSVAQSLGVHCDYCHVKSGEKWVWERDDKRPKLIARDMIRMTRAIDPPVTCYTCHRGAIQVARLPPLPPHDPTLDPPRAEIALPTAAEIVKRYLAAVGTANTPFKSTVVEVTVKRSENRTGHSQLSITPPDQVDLITTTAEGTTRLSTKSSPADTAAALRRTAALYDPVRVIEPAAEMKVLGIERIGDRDTWAVAVHNKTYYFDVQTALLVRERTLTETLLAPLPEQIDYDDYRSVDGVMFPFRIRTSNVAPNDTAMKIVDSIRHER